MEGNAIESFKEELRKFSKTTEELLHGNYSLMGITEDDFAEAEKCPDLSRERENLNSRLEELKKENFFLRASLNAWHLTLKNKLEELDEAESTLSRIYNEIWSERENFCLKAEESIGEYGILIEKWRRQKESASDLEGLEKEAQILAGKTGGEGVLRQTEEHEKQETEVERGQGGVREGGDRDEEREERVSSEGSKRVRGEEVKPTENELFSIVDLEKVRKANRLKQRRQGQHNRQRKLH